MTLQLSIITQQIYVYTHVYSLKLRSVCIYIYMKIRQCWGYNIQNKAVFIIAVYIPCDRATAILYSMHIIEREQITIDQNTAQALRILEACAIQCRFLLIE